MSIHDGHRQNLREEFLKTGLEGKKDHQILELLLTYIVPRKDVNPIAHELISKFGSLSGVIDAPMEELTKTPYITEYGAVLLKLIPQFSKKYCESKSIKKEKINTLEKMEEFAKTLFIGESKEVFYLLSLDTKCNLIGIDKIGTGSLDAVKINIRDIISVAIKNNAVFIAITHNHPSGSPSPSAQDITVTEKIKNALAPIDIKLVEHIIVSGNEVFAFSKNNLLERG